MSMRGAAHALNYDVGYLSRAFNGKQSPSLQLAEGLDALLEMPQRLVALDNESNGLPIADVAAHQQWELKRDGTDGLTVSTLATSLRDEGRTAAPTRR
ncbi:helix-turn-helix domain-containing protein [Streptomyces sp. NPDC059906]|uniref:helix-turn-helix domain-containing protein n=1 Tax=Streptomyces sp. NPDC059906 TaxID=3346997 RepID=UPI0036689943